MTAEPAEADIVAALKANLESAKEALRRNDRAALMALAEQEAPLHGPAPSHLATPEGRGGALRGIHNCHGEHVLCT